MADTINIQQRKLFPGQTTDSYPELFDIRAMLPQPDVLKPGQQPENLIKEYFEKGYIIIEDFFRDDELQPARDAVNNLVDDIAIKLYKAGKISNLYEEYGFTQRLTKLEEEFPDANIIVMKYSQERMSQAFKDIWTNERLLNLVEQIIGPDIAGNPVWNIRTKVPKNNIVTVPWHQDSAYLDNDTYRVLIPTAWIPLVDANEANGCMEVVEGGHKTGRMATHKCCWKDTFFTYLEEDEMNRTLASGRIYKEFNSEFKLAIMVNEPSLFKLLRFDCTNKEQQKQLPGGVDVERDRHLCEIRSGSLLFFNNIIPHRSLPNVSDGIRWSLDLRWQKDGSPGGLWGLKDGVTMRKANDPNYKVDWTQTDAVNRSSVQTAYMKGEDLDEKEEEFDTTLQGPWMKQWEIVHSNRHVERFMREEKAKSQKAL